MGEPPVVELPACAPDRRALAIAAALPADRLRAGAEAILAGRDDDDARRFGATLELAYLAASADGLDDGEREVLAGLLEQATGAAVDRATLHTHFSDLDAAVAMLGRRERLVRSAADIGDESAAEAIEVAALVAMADGALFGKELAVLVELGACLGQGFGDVRDAVDRAAARVKEALS